MAGIIGRGVKIEEPPIAGTPMNIAPLGVVLWDNQEVPPGATTIIDTFGFTYLTLFVDVNRPATMILESVSGDGIHWRGVGDLVIRLFDMPGRAFINLNEVITTKEVLMYRFLKIRIDTTVPVKITLEVASKLMDLLPALQEIRDAVKVGFGIPLEVPVIKIPEIPVVKPPEVPVPPEFKPILEELEEIHKLLETRFTNAVAWDHDQKNVTTPGTPVQLPGLVVPDGYALVVMAKSGNKGDVYLGNSKDSVSDTSKQVPLEAKDSTKFEVKKASALWLDAANAGEGVVFWCERLTEV